MAGDLDGTALIFDLDGTLVDTVDDLAAGMNHALVRMGLAPAPAAAVRHLVGHGAKQMLLRGFEIAAGRPPADAEIEEAVAAFIDHYEANIAIHSRPFDGVIEMIEAFRRRGVKMAICTNKRQPFADLLVRELGLGPLFDSVVGADFDRPAKPDPHPVHMCLSQTGVRRAVFFGDSDTDIRAAKAAGLPCLVADFGYGPITLASEATAMFSSYRDAGALVEAALGA